jgi:Transposase DDE domain
MHIIIQQVAPIMCGLFPEVDLSPLPAKIRGHLWLDPERFLMAIQAPVLALWALQVSTRLRRPRLARGPGGRPATYHDATILLMAIIQTAWRMSYADIVDYVASTADLARYLGFPGQASGQVHTISQGQYWERRAALGIYPFLFFFLAVVAAMIRLGLVTGQELIVDSSLLAAWRHADPGATWQKYTGRAAVFGYKVHTLLCHQADLPVLVLVTPAHVHDSLMGWLLVLLAVLIFELPVWIVYADAAYFDKRFFGWVHDWLGAHPAVDYNLRREGKRKLATPFFLGQWRQYVLGPRSAIERHFAWAKRYFGLKYFQCFTYIRVTQFILLTYIVIVAVAVAAQRYQRPDLVRSRSQVLAHARP